MKRVRAIKPMSDETGRWQGADFGDRNETLSCCAPARDRGSVLIAMWSRSPAHAEPRAVIELFTSQGCSSCPAADKLLGELAKDPSIVAMSLSVDYWDYLGWKDTLALAAATATASAPMRARAATAKSIPRRLWSTASRMCSAATRPRSSTRLRRRAATARLAAVAGQCRGRRRQADGERAGRQGRARRAARSGSAR